MKKERKFIEVSYLPSEKGDYLCRDGEVESCVESPDGVWIPPDPVRGLGVGPDEDPDSDPPEVSLPPGSAPGSSRPDGSNSVIIGGSESSPDPLPSAPTSSPLFKLPAGMRLLCAHPACRLHPALNYIFQSAEGRILWSASSSPTLFRGFDPGLILKRVSSASSLGDMLMLLTEDGIEYLLCDEGGYRHLGRRPPGMTVEFALERRPVTGFNLLSSQWPCGEIRPREAGDFLAAYESGCRGENLFTAPFFAMGAMRLADGSRLPLSLPVLMIPNSEAPLLRVDAVSENDEDPRYAVSLLSRACRLCMRILPAGAMPGSDISDSLKLWSGVAESFEVLVSPQVKLREEGDVERHLRSVTHSCFSRSAEGDVLSDGALRLRGDGDTPASDGSRIRALTGDALPRGSVEAGILESSRMRVLSEIPWDSLWVRGGAADGFVTVPISPGMLSSIDDSQPVDVDLSVLTRSLPVGLRTVNSRLMAWGGMADPPLPPPIRGGNGFSGDTAGDDSGMWSVSVEVVIERGGLSLQRNLFPVTGSGVLSPHTVADPADAFPRWVFYPDPDARRIRFTARRGAESVSMTLPLRRHPRLYGAYCFRGLAPDINTPLPTGNEGEFSSSLPRVNYLPTPHMAAISREGNPLFFPASGHVSAGEGMVCGMAPAVRSLSSGQLGVFPLYLFSSAGIWAVAAADDGFRSVQPISLCRCVRHDSILPTPHGTLFLSPSGVMLLDGSKVSSLPLPETLTFSYSELQLWYDAGREQLYLFRPGHEDSMRYDFIAKEWTPTRFSPLYVAGIDGGETHLCAGGAAGGSMAVDADGNVFSSDALSVVTSSGAGGDGSSPGDGSGDILLPGGDVGWGPGLVPSRPDSGVIVPPPPKARCWQVTLRPLKLTTPHTRLRVWGVRCGGAGLSDVRLRLYGGMRPGEWHPLAEGEGSLRALSGSGWRYWRLQLCYRSVDPRALQFLIFSIVRS